MPALTDDHLLLGVLALDQDIISAEQLVEALRRWTQSRNTPLPAILADQGLLTGDQGERLEQLRRKLLLAPQATAYHPPPDPGRTTDHHPGPAVTPHDTVATCRYLTLREHARGGLGEVAVALDRELNREVALKQIQPRYADHPVARSRFVREAEITGNLEHPGIVPVYGLGADEKGRPWYAMRFIKGQSLHDALTHHHQAGPDPLRLRQLLNRFVAVCNAVAFAHSRGVIHRDIKPENVMLGEYGETLLVDWGLAKASGGAAAPREGEEADLAALPQPRSPGDDIPTQQGHALGTPAYMPPEQARGDLEQMGPASDIFSLGATLYAILTGRPPYLGETALTDAEDARWIPARHINRAIPASLEAICARAMAREHAARYGTAKELGDEVERWLADEPVKAHREPLLDRARRWARKHRTLVTAGVVFLLVSVIALGGGLYAVGAEQKRTIKERDRAQDNERDAIAAKKEALENLKTAEANLALAKKAVNECFDVARDHSLLQDDRMAGVRKLLFEKALPFYERFQAIKPDDPAAQADLAGQLFRVGVITAEIADKDKARKAYERSCRIYRALIARQPAAKLRHELAGTLINLGIVLKDQEKHREAIAAYEEARTLLEGLIKKDPSRVYQTDLAILLLNLGNVLLQQDKQNRAIATYQEAAGLFRPLIKKNPAEIRPRRALATTLANLAVVCNKAGEKAEALTAFREAKQLQEALVQHNPTPAARNDLARTLNGLGSLLCSQGKTEEGLKAFTQAEHVYAELVKDYPAIIAFRRALASVAYNRGIQVSQDDRAEAIRSFRLAADQHELLHKKNPTVPDHLRGLADAAYNLAEMLRVEKKPTEAIDAYGQARDAYASLVKRYPDVLEHSLDLIKTASKLAYLCQEQGKAAEAEAAWGLEKDTYGPLIEKKPGVVKYQRYQAIAAVNRAIMLAERGRLTQAMEDLDLALMRSKIPATKDDDPTKTKALRWRLHLVRGHTLDRLKRHREAIAMWETARELAPGTSKGMIQMQLCFSLARAGEADRGLREAATIAGGKPPAGVYYSLAGVASLCAAAVTGDRTTPLPRREQLASRCERQALVWLGEARDKGFFNTPGNVTLLKTNPDLAHLRNQTGFQTFLRTLD